jgi:hypothetical protein
MFFGDFYFYSSWNTIICSLRLVNLLLQEYMFYKQMCVDSKQYDPQDPELPLYRCDFSNGDFASEAGLRMK